MQNSPMLVSTQAAPVTVSCAAAGPACRSMQRAKVAAMVGVFMASISEIRVGRKGCARITYSAGEGERPDRRMGTEAASVPIFSSWKINHKPIPRTPPINPTLTCNLSELRTASLHFAHLHKTRVENGEEHEIEDHPAGLGRRRCLHRGHWRAGRHATVAADPYHRRLDLDGHLRRWRHGQPRRKLPQ